MSALKQEKLKSGTFKHIESELEAYWDSVKELKRLKSNIIHATPHHDNSGGGRSNLPSDPTGSSTVTLLTHRKIVQLETIIRAIRTVHDQLEPEKRDLIQIKYWTHPQMLTWDGIAQKLNVSRRMALYWRDDIIRDIADQLGWS
ncbi:transcriptional regulator [Hazenella sp. IB182357]|uniref:Transcriptional regulator n=1 Tax=Polycladospora coralii TaxID=2771432 RepID=A0A926NBV1_9BACL|nr:transcriptional regulator [Polycladospora coralii]MBD1373733.1 transcriptional regulator [Polycladospora coralii]